MTSRQDRIIESATTLKGFSFNILFDSDLFDGKAFMAQWAFIFPEFSDAITKGGLEGMNRHKGLTSTGNNITVSLDFEKAYTQERAVVSTLEDCIINCAQTISHILFDRKYAMLYADDEALKTGVPQQQLASEIEAKMLDSAKDKYKHLYGQIRPEKDHYERI